MFKKIIALSLTLALLAPASAVLAASIEPTALTAEEILNEYHQKVFQKQASDISLCSDDNNLEKETVEILNNAGYEAYHVTAANYDLLEKELQTDFSAMGLSRESSYIVTMNADTHNLSPLPDQEIMDPGGNTTFTFTYQGVQYQMRYVSITASSDPLLAQTSSIEVNVDKLPKGFETACGIVASEIGLAPVVTLLDIIEANLPDGVETVSSSILYQACSVWNVTYVQIYNTTTSEWQNCASMEYVSQACYIHYTYYEPSINQYEQSTSYQLLGKQYSKYYYTDSIKELATIAFDQEKIYYDYRMEVEYYHENTVVITHQRSLYAG